MKRILTLIVIIGLTVIIGCDIGRVVKLQQ